MELSAVLERAMEITDRGDRIDLRKRLEGALARLQAPDVRVMVVGEFKQGKSQLVNALVGAPVCPVDDDVATSVPTTVRFGDRPEAAVLDGGRTAAEGGAGQPAARRRSVPIEALAELVSERGNPGNERGIQGAEISLPSPLLKGGLALVDSPGVGGLNSAHTLETLAALPSAHALLFVTDASQEFTEPEMEFLRKASRICPNIAVVLSKIDLTPEWRRIAQLDAEHLARVGMGAVPLLPVSSSLRIHALQFDDPQLYEESGFPALVAHLRGGVLGNQNQLMRRAAAQDLRTTAEHLGMSYRSELQALEHPSATPELLAQLQTAKERSEELRKHASRWQTTLNDGMADLISDLDHDLRDRLRRVQREAERAIDEGDPGPVWDRMVEWFEQRAAAAVGDTFVWTDERAAWLGERIAEHFEQEAVSLPVLSAGEASHVFDRIDKMSGIESGRVGFVQAGLVSMKGSYGGVIMIGLVTSIMGMSLLNPISLAAGVLLGGKALRDDRKARLARRQGEAKILVRRQVDDIVFHVGKQLKDRLRLVQRSIRDHFTDIAEEYHRTIGASLSAAQKAASLYESEAKERIAFLRKELGGVDWLGRAAHAVDPDGGSKRAEGGPGGAADAGSAASAAARGPVQEARR